jgi:adenylate kinase
MRIVLIGMPGAGKGTQAARLRQALGVPHVSTGDILREAVREGSSLGRKVKDTLDSGGLVPDEWMESLIHERLSRPDAAAGFILDGFPRTREQVRMLDEILRALGIEIDAVVLLTAPTEEVVRRLSGRRVCPKCAALFHVDTNPPAVAGICDRCGAGLSQREDDGERVVRSRLAVYERETAPVVELYRERGTLRTVDAGVAPDEVFGRLCLEIGHR